MDFSLEIRRRRPTTSWLVMPPGLSITRSPFTLTTLADRAAESMFRLKCQGRQSRSGTGLADQRQEFGARLFLAEAANHGAGDGGRVLLLNAAHHHAQVARLNDHPHALGRNGFLDGVGDLAGKPLLHLQTAGKYFN